LLRRLSHATGGSTLSMDGTCMILQFLPHIFNWCSSVRAVTDCVSGHVASSRAFCAAGRPWWGEGFRAGCSTRGAACHQPAEEGGCACIRLGNTAHRRVSAHRGVSGEMAPCPHPLPCLLPAQDGCGRAYACIHQGLPQNVATTQHPAPYFTKGWRRASDYPPRYLSTSSLHPNTIPNLRPPFAVSPHNQGRTLTRRLKRAGRSELRTGIWKSRCASWTCMVSLLRS
jgi:hypothetical protein